MSELSTLPSLFVLGWGFFSTHHASASDANGDERCEPRKPKFELLVARARRFTSLVTQMHVEVCGQALAATSSKGDDRPHTIFASHHGELQIAADLISDLLSMKSVSSARFALSVHNAPSGLVSIATRNPLSTTTVAAGESSFAAGLLETFLIAQERGGTVLLSFADEPVPALFGGPITEVGTGFAVLLTTEPSDGAIGTLSLSELRSDDAPLPFQGTARLASLFERGIAESVHVGSLRPGHAINVAYAKASAASAAPRPSAT